MSGVDPLRVREYAGRHNRRERERRNREATTHQDFVKSVRKEAPIESGQ